MLLAHRFCLRFVMDDSEHVEVLLGVYARQLSSMLWEIQYLLARLESKREFVSLALASYRNRMVRYVQPAVFVRNDICNRSWV